MRSVPRLVFRRVALKGEQHRLGYARVGQAAIEAEQA